MKGMLGSRRFWVVLLVLAAAAAAGGFAWRKRVKDRETPPATVKVERGDVELKYSEAGEVVPEVKVLVRSPVQGTVASLAADEGDKVRKGEKLAVIQPGRSKAERFLPIELFAPIDGTVLERYVQAGESVQDTGDQSRLLALTDLSRMEVLLPVNEVDILKIRSGMPARLTLDALPKESFEGKVRFVSPGVKGQKEGERWNDPQKGVKTFEVRVALARRDPRFRPGMTVRVELKIDGRKDALKVPLSAVEEKAGEARVFLPGTPPVPRDLKLGLRADLVAEVLEGLKEGETILEQKPEDAPERETKAKGAARGVRSR